MPSGVLLVREGVSNLVTLSHSVDEPMISAMIGADKGSCWRLAASLCASCKPTPGIFKKSNSPHSFTYTGTNFSFSAILTQAPTHQQHQEKKKKRKSKQTLYGRQLKMGKRLVDEY